MNVLSSSSDLSQNNSRHSSISATVKTGDKHLSEQHAFSSNTRLYIWALQLSIFFFCLPRSPAPLQFCKVFESERTWMKLDPAKGGD